MSQLTFSPFGAHPRRPNGEYEAVHVEFGAHPRRPNGEYEAVQVGPHSEGQNRRWLIRGAKFKVLQIRENGKTYILYAGMSRYSYAGGGKIVSGEKDMEHTLVAHREDLRKLMEIITRNRKNLNSFKVYYKDFSYKEFGKRAIEVRVGTDLVDANGTENDAADELEKTFPHVDFTLRSTERKGLNNYLATTDISETKAHNQKIDFTHLLKVAASERKSAAEAREDGKIPGRGIQEKDEIHVTRKLLENDEEDHGEEELDDGRIPGRGKPTQAELEEMPPPLPEKPHRP